jgi:hypothetical protein
MSKLSPQVVAAIVGFSTQLPVTAGHASAVDSVPSFDAGPTITRLQSLPSYELRSMIRFLAVEKSVSGCALWMCKAKSHGEVGPS